MKQPKAFVITQQSATSHVNSIRSCRQSQLNSQATITQAQKFGWDVSAWPATDGYTITNQSWELIGVTLLDRGAIVKRPGARGCFHSHFSLWQHCVLLQEPIIVMEHDAWVQGPWPADLDLNRCIWKLHLADGRGDQINEITGLWSRGAWAYTLTPGQAATLVTFSKTNGAQAVDKQIGDTVVPWQYLTTNLVIHKPHIRGSTTSPKVDISYT